MVTDDMRELLAGREGPAMHENISNVLADLLKPPEGVTDYEWVTSGLEHVLQERLAAAGLQGLAATLSTHVQALKDERQREGYDAASPPPQAPPASAASPVKQDSPAALLQLFEYGDGRRMGSLVRLPSALRGLNGSTLPGIVAWLPRLATLRLALDPPRPSKHALELRRALEPESGRPAVSRTESIGTVSQVVKWFDPAMAIEAHEGELHGCLPWRLLDVPSLTSLGIEVHGSKVSRNEMNFLSSGHHCVGRRTGWTHLSSLFVALALSSHGALRRLSVRGIAPALLETLLCLELPRLVELRCGAGDAQGGNRVADVLWPIELLPRLAHAFPSLRALDVAYAVTPHGVSFRDVQLLCARCPSIWLLDLSQVMTYVDFGPALVLLVQHAPQLVGLAIHGLHLPDEPLTALAAGCPLLHRLHLIHCRYSLDALGTFLRSAPTLVHLDLSGGDVPADALCEWVDECYRRRAPVRSLALMHCADADEVATRVHALVETWTSAARGSEPISSCRGPYLLGGSNHEDQGPRPSLFDAMAQEIARGECDDLYSCTDG